MTGEKLGKHSKQQNHGQYINNKEAIHFQALAYRTL